MEAAVKWGLRAAVVLAAIILLLLWQHDRHTIVSQLESVRDSARIGAMQAATSKGIAAVAIADGQREHATALDQMRRGDSLLRLFSQTVAGVPARPPGPVPEPCLPWQQRADGLAGALEIAKTALVTKDSSIASQERSLASYRVATDTLTGALVTAQQHLTQIASKVDTVIVRVKAQGPRLPLLGLPLPQITIGYGMQFGLDSGKVVMHRGMQITIGYTIHF